MSEAAIKDKNKFKYSNLFSDFLQDRSKLKKYLFYDNAREVAGLIKTPKIDRFILCDILEKQSKSVRSKPETFRSIEKLRQEDTLVVFAGQQPGLYGGPLLTLYKAMGIVKRAVQLQSQTGKPVVPIFWIACDDHDFEEVNHTHCTRRDGSVGKMEYLSASQLAVPVADICFDHESGYNDMVVGRTHGGADVYLIRCRISELYLDIYIFHFIFFR